MQFHGINVGGPNLSTRSAIQRGLLTTADLQVLLAAVFPGVYADRTLKITHLLRSFWENHLDP